MVIFSLIEYSILSLLRAWKAASRDSRDIIKIEFQIINFNLPVIDFNLQIAVIKSNIDIFGTIKIL